MNEVTMVTSVSCEYFNHVFALKVFEQLSLEEWKVGKVVAELKK